ncbi:uncharacterized protein DS421_17g580720 [Arachis hypogaea]|nr:uncharacterized protein DS421_17g580720 [Arachis hypogaea]
MRKFLLFLQCLIFLGLLLIHPSFAPRGAAVPTMNRYIPHRRRGQKAEVHIPDQQRQPVAGWTGASMHVLCA